MVDGSTHWEGCYWEHHPKHHECTLEKLREIIEERDALTTENARLVAELRNIVDLRSDEKRHIGERFYDAFKFAESALALVDTASTRQEKNDARKK